MCVWGKNPLVYVALKHVLQTGLCMSVSYPWLSVCQWAFLFCLYVSGLSFTVCNVAKVLPHFISSIFFFQNIQDCRQKFLRVMPCLLRVMPCLLHLMPCLLHLMPCLLHSCHVFCDWSCHVSCTCLPSDHSLWATISSCVCERWAAWQGAEQCMPSDHVLF